MDTDESACEQDFEESNTTLMDIDESTIKQDFVKFIDAATVE